MTRARGVMILALVLVTPGCFTVHGQFGAPIPLEAVSKVRDGETTRQEITSWFGPPAAFDRPGLLDLIFAHHDEIEGANAPVFEDVYSYRYVESRVQMRVFPFAFLSVRAHTVADSLIVFFDEEGRVRYHAYRRDDPETARDLRGE